MLLDKGFAALPLLLFVLLQIFLRIYIDIQLALCLVGSVLLRSTPGVEMSKLLNLLRSLIKHLHGFYSGVAVAVWACIPLQTLFKFYILEGNILAYSVRSKRTPLMNCLYKSKYIQ